jgi:hypothetical protein
MLSEDLAARSGVQAYKFELRVSEKQTQRGWETFDFGGFRCGDDTLRRGLEEKKFRTPLVPDQTLEKRGCLGYSRRIVVEV